MSEQVLTDILEMSLPSGVLVRCHEMTVSDANRLANPKRRDQALYDVLRSRVKVVAEDRSEKSFDPMMSTMGDVFAAMFGVRRVTHGDEFQFNCQCSKCSKQWRHMVDLSADYYASKPIKWTDGTDLTQGVHRETLQFVVTLTSPHNGISQVRCQLLRGAHQSKISEIDEKSEDCRISELMKLRIVGFEGKINPTDKDRPADKQRLQYPTDEWITGMSLRKQREFSRQFDEFDGGIESNIDLECPKCSYIHYDYPLPFRDRDFFSPR